MRILIIHHSLDLGGAETQLINLINQLSKFHQITLVLYYPSIHTERQLNKIPNIRCLFAKGQPGFGGFLKRFRSVFAVAQSNKFDVVLTYLVGTNLTGLLLAKLLRIPRIVWGLRITPLSRDQMTIRTVMLEKLFMALSRYCSILISNSYSAVALYSEVGLSAPRVEVIPNGIDTTRFYPDAARRSRARSRLGVGEDQIVVGVVSRLVPWKGYEVLLRAIPETLDHFPNTMFVMVGGGSAEYRRYLETTQFELNIDGASIIWLGHRHDTDELMNAFDVFSLPSLSGEATSNSLLEAMATGVPVVATKVGDSERIVGRFGSLVAPGDPAELTRTYLSIFEDYAFFKKQAETGRQIIEEEFSISRNTGRFCQLLTQK